jgi:hypothetical protein
MSTHLCEHEYKDFHMVWKAFLGYILLQTYVYVRREYTSPSKKEKNWVAKMGEINSIE